MKKVKFFKLVIFLSLFSLLCLNGAWSKDEKTKDEAAPVPPPNDEIEEASQAKPKPPKKTAPDSALILSEPVIAIPPEELEE